MANDKKSLAEMALAQRSRRQALQMVGGVGAFVFLGCGSSDGAVDGLPVSEDEARRGPRPDASTPPGTPEAGVDAGGGAAADGGVVADAGAGVDWATGGTGILSGKDYGNPFAGGVGPTCTVYKDMMLGPCHARTVDRQDISEAQPGLPTRLEFLLLDANCKPLSNATIEIWHCSTAGLYSGDDAVQMCTSGNAAALAARWFRGIRTADANGRVTFDTCFPGWYHGRTVHIHFTIAHNGTGTKTSQLFFDDALKKDIFTKQPEYAARGVEDTTNAKDGVYKGSGMSLADACMSTAKQKDGALVAWKGIVVA